MTCVVPQDDYCDVLYTMYCTVREKAISSLKLKKRPLLVTVSFDDFNREQF